MHAVTRSGTTADLSTYYKRGTYQEGSTGVPRFKYEQKRGENKLYFNAIDKTFIFIGQSYFLTLKDVK